MEDFIYNAFGLVGVGLLILAYLLLQIGKIKADEILYPALNLIGAVLHVISLIKFWNLASLVIEIFWIAISLYGIWKIKRNMNA
ncbi:MAG: hypothetical protein SFT90_05835 [Rickettsiales bacterium]|nr:hypothetical protein [Rickettsiales bacterium]